MINYGPLWKTMKKKGITKYRLVKDFGFSNGTMDRFRANEHTSTYTIEKLCKILDCSPNEIFEVIEDK